MRARLMFKLTKVFDVLSGVLAYVMSIHVRYIEFMLKFARQL